jgi:hypothetical protein
MLLRMEHANICVDSVDQKADFLMTAFPEFGVRAEGVREEDGSRKRWIHLGTDSVYVTLGEVKRIVDPTDHQRQEVQDEQGTGVGHLGYVVDDVASVAERLSGAGDHVGRISEEGPGALEETGLCNGFRGCRVGVR